MLESIIEKSGIIKKVGLNIGNVDGNLLTRGVNIFFKKDTPQEEALEIILELLKEYYSLVLENADYANEYIRYKKFWIEKNVDELRKTKPDLIASYNMFGNFKGFGSHMDYHHRKHTKIFNNLKLGFFQVWVMPNERYLANGIHFFVRLRGQLKYGFHNDKATIEKDAKGFSEYLNGRLTQKPYPEIWQK